MTEDAGAGDVMRFVVLIWSFLRYVFALAGFVCLLITLTAATGWFTVSVDGEQLEWYWLLGATLVFGLASTLRPFPEAGDRRRQESSDQWLAPSLDRPIPRMVRATVVAGLWGGLTYLLGLDLIVILAVAGLVGFAYAFRRPREGGRLE